MPLATDPHRALAIKVALQEIDNHLGEFDTLEKVREMLSSLITRDELKDRPKSANRAVIPLTVNRFHDIMSKTMSSKRRPGAAVRAWTEVWTRGSVLVEEDYLRTVGFQSPTNAGVADTGGNIEAPRTAASGSRTEPLIPGPAGQQLSQKPSAPDSTLPIVIPDDDGAPDVVRANGRPKRQRDNNTDGLGVTAGEPAQKKQRTIPESPNAKAAMPEDETLPGALPGVQGAQETLKPAPPLKSQREQISPLAASLVRLGTDEITNALEGVWSNVQNIIRNMLDGIPHQRAAWVADPHDGLKKVFERLFGQDYNGRILEITSDRPTSNRDALEACLAAAMFEYAFQQDLPWDGPKEMLASIKGDAAVIDRVLEAIGCRRPLDYVIWQAAKAKLDFILDEDEFRDTELQRMSEELAKKILLVLDRQTHTLGAKVKARTIENLAKAVKKVLIIRGKMRAAPAYYRIGWPKSGTEMKRKTQVDLPEDEGRKEVLWCVSPGVVFRMNESETWTAAIQAKVFVRPWAENES
ncbi:hypothetical protein LTR17_010923 [Elasticomyces elasticus]|nr:hypothetical protein LTR17_010923 [Elasticomyces elasticus]